MGCGCVAIFSFFFTGSYACAALYLCFCSLSPRLPVAHIVVAYPALCMRQVGRSVTTLSEGRRRPFPGCQHSGWVLWPHAAGTPAWIGEALPETPLACMYCTNCGGRPAPRVGLSWPSRLTPPPRWRVPWRPAVQISGVATHHGGHGRGGAGGMGRTDARALRRPHVTPETTLGGCPWRPCDQASGIPRGVEGGGVGRAGPPPSMSRLVGHQVAGGRSLSYGITLPPRPVLRGLAWTAAASCPQNTKPSAAAPPVSPSLPSHWRRAPAERAHPPGGCVAGSQLGC